MSWIRRKDYHLLTVGLATYTGDERYQAIHIQNSEVKGIIILFIIICQCRIICFLNINYNSQFHIKYHGQFICGNIMDQ